MKRSATIITVLVVFVVVWMVFNKIQSNSGATKSTSENRPYEGEELVVYAYSSYVASWGAGPKISDMFRKKTGAKIRLVDAGDSRLLMQKLEQEKQNPGADVWLGFDQTSMGVFDDQKIELTTLDLGSVKWDAVVARGMATEARFVPYDWSPLTFIYREGEIDPPSSIQDLFDPKYKGQISLIDPRTSNLGFLFLSQILARSNLGIGFSSAVKKLSPQVFAYSPSWSSAYGLFKKGEAKLGWSYLSSAVYHWKEEKDRRYKPVVFVEGHGFQMEFAVVPKNCRQCSLAQEYVKFLLEPDSQKTLMFTNYMFPVVDGLVEGTEFSELPKVDITTQVILNSIEQKQLVEQWKSANQ